MTRTKDVYYFNLLNKQGRADIRYHIKRFGWSLDLLRDIRDDTLFAIKLRLRGRK